MSSETLIKAREWVEDVMRSFLSVPGQTFDYSKIDEEFLQAFNETADQAAKTFPKFAELYSLLSELDVKEIQEAIKEEIYSSNNVKYTPGEGVIKRERHKEWLSTEKNKISWDHWTIYKNYLKTKKFKRSSIDNIDKVSDIVVDLLEKPDVQDLPISGLLYGEVQAGKTATYTAVIHKAADAGWRIIIILTSNSKDLRLQTQERINFDVLGEANSADSKQKCIGIGLEQQKYEHKNGKIRKFFQTFTNTNDDFSVRQKGRSLSKQPGEVAIFVCKKETTVLKNLQWWFGEENYRNYTRNLPCLIIDDEADWASINTRRDEDPTTINEGIRLLLKGFRRSAYLAVTATPYANIFIDPQIGKRDESNVLADLFPHDFIVPVIPPPDYYGVEKLFGIDPELGYNKLNEQIVIPLGESDDPESETFNSTSVTKGDRTEKVPSSSLKKGDRIENLPPSLIKAIRYFVCCCAYTDIRLSDDSKATMLIHVDRFISHHKDIEELVRKLLEKDKNHIYMYQSLPIEELEGDQTYLSYKEIWEHSCQRVGAKEDVVPFCELSQVAFRKMWKQNLYAAINAIQIKVINGKSREKGILKKIYSEKRPRLIAVGGNALGRGITLEGLCVSYLSRSPQAADTLLQLGRFFGYRQRCLKYMKVWLSDFVCNAFEYAAEVTRDFRDRTIQMNHSKMTPDDFGMCLKADPEGIRMKITAANKARHSDVVKLDVNFGGAYQTQRFMPDKDVFSANQKFLSDYFKKLPNPDKRNITVSKVAGDADIVWSNIRNEQILELLEGFKCIGWSRKMPHNLMTKLIREDNSGRTWEIRLISVSGTEPIDVYGLGEEFKIGVQSRAELIKKKSLIGDYCIFRRGALMSGEHIARRFNGEKYKKVLEELRDGKRNLAVADVLDIDHETAPSQLLVYTARIENQPDFDFDLNQLVCGLAIGLPMDKNLPPKKKETTYQVNEIYMLALADDNWR